MNYFLLVALGLVSFNRAFAQAVPSIPIQFGQFFNSYSTINPASNGARADIEFELGKQRGRGSWRNYSTTYATGSFRLNQSKKPTNFHVPGVTFFSDIEGQYIKRSKLFFNYAWHTKLTKKVSFSAGASAGLFSYVVSAQSSGLVGSDNAPDASIGLWLYSERYYIGTSINQILNSKLTPIEEQTQLLRHYNITGGYFFALSKSLVIAPKALIRYAPDHPVNVDLATIAIVDDVVSGGINYRHQKNFVTLVGLERLNVGKGRFRAMFSYSVPIEKTSSPVHTYELTLNYHHKPVKKKKGN
jgi:type IX secretion system PorP/SprF family membrane protein